MYRQAAVLLPWCLARRVSRLQGVRQKGDSCKGESTVGVWHHIMDGHHKITDTWFLRQMTSNEVDRKVCSRRSPCRHVTASTCHLVSLHVTALPASLAGAVRMRGVVFFFVMTSICALRLCMTVAQYAVRERGAAGNVGKSFLHTQHAPRPRAATRKKLQRKFRRTRRQQRSCLLKSQMQKPPNQITLPDPQQWGGTAQADCHDEQRSHAMEQAA